MAYDYEATSLNETYMNMGYTTTPLTPFESVYYSLRVFTDAQTGVPAEKAVLGLAMDSAQWKLKDGKVQNSTPYRPYYSAIYERLQQSGTVIQYHARYRNPFATFTNAEDGTENVVWYEDERSLEEKIQLGKLFDMNGLSVWRLGLIPDYQDGSEYYLDVWNKVLK